MAIDRLGKRVVVRLDDGCAVVFEPRMTGLVLVADPPTREHLRLRIHLETNGARGGRPVAGKSSSCFGTGADWVWFAR